MIGNSMNDKIVPGKLYKQKITRTKKWFYHHNLCVLCTTEMGINLKSGQLIYPKMLLLVKVEKFDYHQIYRNAIIVLHFLHLNDKITLKFGPHQFSYFLNDWELI